MGRCMGWCMGNIYASGLHYSAAILWLANFEKPFLKGPGKAEELPSFLVSYGIIWRPGNLYTNNPLLFLPITCNDITACLVFFILEQNNFLNRSSIHCFFCGNCFGYKALLWCHFVCSFKGKNRHTIRFPPFVFMYCKYCNVYLRFPLLILPLSPPPLLFSANSLLSLPPESFQQ